MIDAIYGVQQQLHLCVRSGFEGFHFWHAAFVRTSLPPASGGKAKRRRSSVGLMVDRPMDLDFLRLDPE